MELGDLPVSVAASFTVRKLIIVGGAERSHRPARGKDSRPDSMGWEHSLLLSDHITRLRRASFISWQDRHSNRHRSRLLAQVI